MAVRTFVLLGQGGRMTSPGMVSLAQRLGASVNSWNDGDVLSAINQTKGKIAVIGYSLGANQLGWISKYVTRKIDLGVAYDPSWMSPLVKYLDGKYAQVAPKFNRLICYRNSGAWIWGGSTYTGKNVEEHVVNAFHLGIQFNETLHQKTIAAVAALKG